MKARAQAPGSQSPQARISGLKLLAILAALLALAALLIAILFLGFRVWLDRYGVFSEERFDAPAWFAPPTKKTGSTCYRGRMANDIRDRLLKPGMTPADVKRVLGTPDDERSSSEYGYVLGMCSGLGMDYDVLHVYFDADAKLTRAVIIQH